MSYNYYKEESSIVSSRPGHQQPGTVQETGDVTPMTGIHGQGSLLPDVADDARKEGEHDNPLFPSSSPGTNPE
jgi:hypothetical protein